MPSARTVAQRTGVLPSRMGQRKLPLPSRVQAMTNTRKLRSFSRLTRTRNRKLRLSLRIVATRQRQPTVLRVLPTAERNRTIARASMAVALATSRRYMVVDTHGDAVYAAPAERTLMPLYTSWQSEVLSAVRMLRRWNYYADALPDAALPNQPLDACHCRVCLERSDSAAPGGRKTA